MISQSQRFNVVTILAPLLLSLMIATTARADGLIEGIADEINDATASVIAAAESTGAKIAEESKPAIETFSRNVNQTAIDLADAVSSAADRVKKQFSAHSSSP